MRRGYFLRRFLWGVVILGGCAVLFIGGFLGYMTWTDYRPLMIENITVENNNDKLLKVGQQVRLISFNIGYCGLDQSQDFFMDGGKMSRSSSREQTQRNLEDITQFLTQELGDFILLQEVDVKSSRSFGLNQAEAFKKAFPGYSSTFALNYLVPWVPVPVLHPMGSVSSGLMTLSGYQIRASNRYQYPGLEKWPRQLFELDRCFVENRVPVDNGKELLLINSHLSAFDEGGLIRKRQLDFLKAHITEEYQKGNYVIVGGDWNHNIPGTDPSRFPAEEAWPFWLQTLPADFTPPGFAWAADPTIPSVRTVAVPYRPGYNFLAVIDGFLVSPNITIQEVRGTQLNVTNSDHNPVKAVFVLH